MSLEQPYVEPVDDSGHYQRALSTPLVSEPLGNSLKSHQSARRQKSYYVARHFNSWLIENTDVAPPNI